MLRLKDGPAEGVYMVKYAPDYLRAVVDKDGDKDVLDAPTDTAHPTETIYVYRKTMDGGRVHVRTTRGGGFYASAEYEYMEDVHGDPLRYNAAWVAWLEEQDK